MIKKVLLFGAGASNGCGDVYPHEPPLGSEVFSKLSNEFPHSWGKLPKELNELFTKDFEKGMDVLWKKYSYECQSLLKEMGIYFCKFAPVSKELSEYAKIVNLLMKRGKNDVLLSTLNYDCLLDGELTENNIKVNYLFDGKNRSGCPLIKLHGSSNWFIDFDGPNRYVSFSSDIRIEAPIYSLNTQEKVIKKLMGDTPFYSVMCLYTKDKPAPLCPSFFQHLYKEWSHSISNAKEVILIGVKPNSLDKHIWQPLLHTQAEILYIGNEDKFSRWHNDSGRVANTSKISDRFEDGIGHLLKMIATG